MANNNERYYDSSSKPWIGVLAVLVVVAVPCLPAILQWAKHLTA